MQVIHNMLHRFGWFVLAAALALLVTPGMVRRFEALAPGTQPLGAGANYACQNSAPGPAGSARNWIRCSDGAFMHTDANNVDSALVDSVVTRTADAAIGANLLTKPSTTAGRYVVLLTSDVNTQVAGVSQSAATGAASTYQQWETPGTIVTVTTDGVSSINPGDVLSVSSTTAGNVTKGTASPICTATAAVAATPGLTITCQLQ